MQSLLLSKKAKTNCNGKGTTGTVERDEHNQDDKGDEILSHSHETFA